MEVCMSAKQNLIEMSISELRAYVLQHRNDQQALQAYLDKVHAENPTSRIHTPEENVGDALAEYLQPKT
jgi:hypothetical protein